MSLTPSRIPDDEQLYLELTLLVYRDGEEGVEHPHLLTATVDPRRINTVAALKRSIAAGVSKALTWHEPLQNLWRELGESVSLLDLSDNGMLEIVAAFCPNLRWLTMIPLLPAAVDVGENLVPDWHPEGYEPNKENDVE